MFRHVQRAAHFSKVVLGFAILAVLGCSSALADDVVRIGLDVAQAAGVAAVNP